MTKEKGETNAQAQAALMRHDFGRLKEVLAVLRWLMKWGEGNSDWDSKRLAKLENQTGNVGAVGAKRA
jgi:hypothetical protein